MIPGKKGVVLLAKMAGLPIIPVALEGTEKLLPINDDNMNREFFRKAKVRVKIGNPVQLPAANADETKHDWEERALLFLMDHIAELLPPEYQGVYGKNYHNEEGILDESV